MRMSATCLYLRPHGPEIVAEGSNAGRDPVPDRPGHIAHQVQCFAETTSAPMPVRMNAPRRTTSAVARPRTERAAAANPTTQRPARKGSCLESGGNSK